MKISIITATYNSEKTLATTIDSVLRQTHHDIEHIIVDGGSSDSTIEIARSYADRYGDGRLKIISEPDNGIYDAMNKGLAMATGDIVGILNSDDFFTTPTVVEKLEREFRHDATLEAVYGDIAYVDPGDINRVVRYYSSESFRRWKMRMGFMPAHPSFYCRREIYDRFGNFDLDFKVAADFENLLRLIYRGRISTRYIPMNFVTMRTGGASTRGFASHKSIMRDHLKAYRKNGVTSGPYLDWLRYPHRLLELLSFRLHTHKNY